MKIADNFYIFNNDMLQLLDNLGDNSVDCIITDPPYELSFMGKGWDSAGVSFQKETWEKCLKVLKPGGYLLAFGGSRTFHRIACAIEDGGFEIRDTIMWLYGSGFPKSMNIGKQLEKKSESKETIEYWNKFGTALKPSFEPIIVARKPFKGSLVDNVIKYGVGGIDIDECRVGNEKLINKGMSSLGVMHDDNWVSNTEVVNEVEGRFPANTILTYDETDFDEVCGGFPVTKKNGSITNPNLKNSLGNGGIYSKYSEKQPLWEAYNDSGSASRYFYNAKASKKDRDEGLEELENKDDVSKRFITIKKNTHPTVKPTELMQYLVRLVSPKGAIILDPFMGSGSTGKAVAYENKERNADYKFIGIEMEKEYCDIAEARIKFVLDKN